MLHAKAVLTSKEFPASQCRCISWKYRMQGQGIGNLKLYIKDKVETRRMIWTVKSEQMKNEWISASATIAGISKASYWVSFEK